MPFPYIQSIRPKIAKPYRGIPFETYLAQDSELLNQKMGTLCLASSTFSRNNDTLQRTRAWLWTHYISLSLANDIFKTPHLYLIRVVCHHGLITYISNSKNMRRVGSPFGSNIQFGMLSVRKMKTLSVSLNNFFLSEFSFIFRLVYSMLRLPVVMFSEWAVTALTIRWFCVYLVL